MDFSELAKARYSVRKFKADPVSRELVEKIVAAGLVAPTAKNGQPQKIIVVTSPEGLDKVKRCTQSFYGATLVMIVCYDEETSWKRPIDGQDSGFVDASIVTTHLMIQAAELGVGSTWVMMFDPAAVKTEFELSDNIVPAAILVMGYAADDAAPSPRHFSKKPKEEIVSYR